MAKVKTELNRLHARARRLFKRLLSKRKLTSRPHEGEFPEWQKALLVIFALNIVLLVALDAHYLAQMEDPARTEQSSLPPEPDPAEKLRYAVDRVLADFGIVPAAIEERGRTRIIHIPRALNASVLQQKLLTCIQQNAGGVFPAPHDRLEFSYALRDQIIETLRLVPETRTRKTSGQIVIVIDDFGYHERELVKQFMRLPFAVTYAIIPGLPHSQSIARKLAAAGKTVIVHMPMEAMEKQVETNGFELSVGMSSTEIRSRVRKAMTLLPQAVGMNNHMGSRATQDQALVQALCEELKAANWCFLDSRTIETTKAFSQAQAHGLAAALNDTFLDSVEELEAVRKKVWRLAEIAEARGSAVGIGHPYQVTLKALQEIVPELQQRGFEFITLEQLLQPKLHATPLPSQPSLARRNG